MIIPMRKSWIHSVYLAMQRIMKGDYFCCGHHLHFIFGTVDLPFSFFLTMSAERVSEFGNYINVLWKADFSTIAVSVSLLFPRIRLHVYLSYNLDRQELFIFFMLKRRRHQVVSLV